MTKTEYKEKFLSFLNSYTDEYRFYKDVELFVPNHGSIKDGLKEAARLHEPVCVPLFHRSFNYDFVYDAIKLNIEMISEWMTNDSYPITLSFYYDDLASSDLGRVCYPDGHLENTDHIKIVLQKINSLTQDDLEEWKEWKTPLPEKLTELGFVIIDLTVEIDPDERRRVIEEDIELPDPDEE